MKARVHEVGLELPERLQDGVRVPLEEPARVGVIVPVGAVGLEVESATEAVQIDTWLTSTGVLHDMLVIVVWVITLKSKNPALTS